MSFGRKHAPHKDEYGLLWDPYSLPSLHAISLGVNVKHLHFGKSPRGWGWMNDRFVKALVVQMPNLQDLQLSGCTMLTDDFFTALPIHTPPLKTLNVSGIKQLSTGEAVMHLAKLKYLTDLDFSDSHYEDHIFVKHLLRWLPQLMNLKLRSTGITDDLIEHIMCPNQLTYLDIHGCEEVPNIRSNVYPHFDWKANEGVLHIYVFFEWEIVGQRPRAMDTDDDSDLLVSA